MKNENAVPPVPADISDPTTHWVAGLTDMALTCLSITVRQEKELRDHRHLLMKAIQSNPGAVREALGVTECKAEDSAASPGSSVDA